MRGHPVSLQGQSITGPRLGPDEQAVLLLVAERLVLGRERYGELHLATDGRDFRREALEEALDGMAYAACALLTGDNGGHEGGRRQIFMTETETTSGEDHVTLSGSGEFMPHAQD